MKMAAAALLLTATAVPPAPRWHAASTQAAPFAGITGGQARLAIQCRVAQRGPAYTLLVDAPASTAFAPGIRVRGTVVAGRQRPVLFTVLRAGPGRATLFATGLASGNYANGADTLAAIAAIAGADDPIEIHAPGIAVRVPVDGLRTALSPAVRRCGDIGAMANRAWHAENGG